MNDTTTTAVAVTHRIYAALLAMCSHDARSDRDRDRGAVSLEQVLWFVAAGVSVAVIAAILWNQIRDEANTGVTPPTAPAP